MHAGRADGPQQRRAHQSVAETFYPGDLPAALWHERQEVKRLRALLDRILNCGERRCWLCDECLHAARDVDRKPLELPKVPDMNLEEREAFFRDLQDPYEVTVR